MTRSAEWTRVRGVLAKLLELPEGERDAALARECGSDVVMLARLRRLLAAGRAHEDLFEPVVPAANDVSAPGLASGESIGAWRLEHRLGAGGMGDVWLVAREGADFRQRGALKVIKRGMDTDSVLTRFRRERRVLAELEHPNIPRLLDGGATSDGRPYFVMEYVEGVAVDAYACERGLDLQARLRLFLRVCEALAHAHEHGVVHRDLKPSNVLVAADGEPKLLDFGIAKVLESDSAAEALDLTLTGQQMLTPRYASPEQLRGEPVTAATDVYALGLILWELLVGRPAVQLDGLTQADLRESICEHAIARPSLSVEPNATGLRRALAGDLDTICAMALRKEPERRYANVKQLAEDVRRHLDGLPVLARPDTMTYRVSKFVRRNRVLVGATLAVIVALAAGLVVALSLYAQSERSRALAEARLDDAEHFAYESAIRGAYSALLSGSPIPDLNAQPPERRGWEWRHITARNDCTERVVWRAPGQTPLALGGGGSTLALCEFDEVVLVDLERDEERARIELTAPAELIALSPDGTRLVTTLGSTMQMHDVATAKPARAHHYGSRAVSIRFTPDGLHVLVGHESGALRAYPIDCLEQGFDLVRLGAFVRGIAVTRNGEYVAACAGLATVAVVRWSDRAVVDKFRHPGNPQYLRGVALLADGRYVASVTNNGEVKIWDRTTDELLPNAPDNAQYCWTMGARADEDELIILGAHLRIWSLATGESRTLPGVHRSILGLAVHPSKPLAYTVCDDGRVHEWDIASEQVPATRAAGETGALAVRPDGRRFAARNDNSRLVRVVDAASRRCVAEREMQSKLARAIAYTPDGGTIVVADGSGLMLLDAGSLQTRSRVDVLNAGVFTVPRDAQVAFVDAHGEWIVRVNLAQPEQQQQRATPFGPIQAIACDPRGECLAVAGGTPTRLATTRWGASSWTILPHHIESGVMALALSPDLRWLAVGGDGHLRVYSVDSGEQQFERLGHKTEDLVFTRDSDRLLAPSGGDLLCIHTGRWTIVATFKDNIRTIHAIAYCAATESVFTSDVSRDVRHYRAAAAPRIDAVR